MAAEKEMAAGPPAIDPGHEVRTSILDLSDCGMYAVSFEERPQLLDCGFFLARDSGIAPGFDQADKKP
jgi:hypothetical protein